MANRNTTTRDRHRAVIARGKPNCALCGEPIDYTLKYPDLQSFVVDHITPLNKGGEDTIENKQAAHSGCNRAKSDKLARNVVLICGPPGAGKSTLAHQLGLTVFDADDPHWGGSETLFRQAIANLAQDDEAQGAVIRSAATLSARQSAAHLCGATQVTVLDTDLDTCIQRIAARGRKTPSIRAQIAAAQDWWNKYEPGAIALTTTGEHGAREFVTSRTW